MKKKWQRSPQELNDAFLSLVEKYPELSLKKMFGYFCVFLNGNMCSGLHEDNWIIRLPEEDRETLMKEHRGTPFVPMPGRPMREYVCLPHEVRSDPSLLKEWFERSVAFTSTLPLKLPKKRTKKVNK